MLGLRFLQNEQCSQSHLPAAQEQARAERAGGHGRWAGAVSALPLLRPDWPQGRPGRTQLSPSHPALGTKPKERGDFTANRQCRMLRACSLLRLLGGRGQSH